MTKKKEYLKFNGELEKAPKDKDGNPTINPESEKIFHGEDWDKEITMPQLKLYDEDGG
jgi:hypothetical protein